MWHVGPALALVVACVAEPKQGHRDVGDSVPLVSGTGSPTTPAGSTTTPTTPTTPTTTPTATGPWLEPGGVVVCADPSLAAIARFDTEWLDVPNRNEKLIESGGFVLADLDGDGVLDLLVAGEPPTTFRGTAGGEAFVADPLGLAGVDLDGMVGGSAADYDGDGDFDLFLTRWELPDLLLRNDGGTFVDVTGLAGLSGAALRSTSSSWDDFDGDGFLDLFVGRYGVTPDLYNDPYLHGDPSSLFRNNGDGTFSDLSATLPQVVQDAYVFMSGWYDIDRDGDRELFVVHDFGGRLQSRMFRNDAGTLVMDDSAAFHPGFEGMGFGVGDVNRDGAPDFLQTSVRTISLLQSTPSGASATGVLYVEAAVASGVQIWPGTGSPKGQDWGWGAELADLDNDGDQDGVGLFGAWDTYFGNPVERDEIWLWDGSTFVEVANAPEWSMDWAGAKRGLAVFDLDGDGTTDLLRKALDEPFRVDRGRCGASSWIEVALDDPTTANRHGVGARIEVTAGADRWTEWIGAGSSGMFTGGPPIAHVGLGAATLIDELCAIWPDGASTCYAYVSPNQRVTFHR